MTAIPLFFGVDVSSKELVIASAADGAPAGPVLHLPNQAQSIKSWLKTLPAGCHIGMEATGIYHRRLADLAFAAGHTVFVLNPREVALYLRSLRARGKTDVLDARGIARYVRNETGDAHPYLPPTPLQEKVRHLIQRRHQVVKQRVSLSMSFAGAPCCAPQFAALRQAFEALIAQLDREIRQTLAQDSFLEAQRQRLCSIPGVGPLISAALTVRLSRVEYPNSDALVAAIGLDPRPRDSGQYTGTRQLSKRGNAEERRLIYLAAVSACRNPQWLAIRSKLLAKGLSKIAANCIVARKLLRIALSIWKSQTSFNPNLVGKACAST